MFSQNNTFEQINDLEAETENSMEMLRKLSGTIVVMGLSNNVVRTLREVFDMYSTVDGGFDTTSIPMKQICDGGYPVSRSQAKRLYFGFDNFVFSRKGILKLRWNVLIRMKILTE